VAGRDLSQSPPGRVSGLGGGDTVGVKKTGEQEVLGLDVGPSEDGAFWPSFLRFLVVQDLSGVRLVVSGAHRGLEGAIEAPSRLSRL
jgi:putative transposase